MFYINQLCIPSFPIGLVKTESGFIVWSVETGLGRWMLVVAVISVDDYPFWAFSDLTCHLQDSGIGVFWLHCLPDSKETELGKSDQEASLSAGNNIGVVLVPCSWWKCVPTTAVSGGVNISEVPGCHLLQQMRAQCGWQKLPQGLLPHELTAYLSIFALFKLN